MVVADTSVVVNLVRIGHAGLLRQIYPEVWIPGKVVEEFIRQTSINPHFHGLKLPTWLQIRTPLAIPENLRTNKLLDAGEQEALALAVEMHADSILIDEENGRKIALHLGLKRIGILGILLRAKANGLIPASSPVFDALQRAANFWISGRLREAVLKQAGEMV